MTQMRVSATNAHLEVVRDRGKDFRAARLEKHKEAVVNNETRAAICLDRIRAARERNV